MKSHKHIPPAVAVFCGLLWLSAATAEVSSPPPAERPAAAAAGMPAGEGLLGYDRLGQPLRLADFRGRVLVVTFWASWCAPCLDELALLENLLARHGEGRLAVVAVNWREDLFQYRASLRTLGATRVRFARDEREAAAAHWQVREIPRRLIFDRQGRLIHDNSGFAPPADARRLIAQLDALLTVAPRDRAIIAP